VYGEALLDAVIWVTRLDLRWMFRIPVVLEHSISAEPRPYFIGFPSPYFRRVFGTRHRHEGHNKFTTLSPLIGTDFSHPFPMPWQSDVLREDRVPALVQRRACQRADQFQERLLGRLWMLCAQKIGYLKFGMVVGGISFNQNKDSGVLMTTQPPALTIIVLIEFPLVTRHHRRTAGSC
jgi:hypothetical protein